MILAFSFSNVKKVTGSSEGIDLDYSNAQSTTTSDNRFISTNHTYVQYVGRYLQIPIPNYYPEIRFDHPGFRIQISVIGVSEISILLRAIRVRDSGQPHRFWTYVDNKLQPEILDTSNYTDDTPRQVLIAQNMDKLTSHTVHIVKVTEYDMTQPKRRVNCMQLAGILIDKKGRLLHLPPVPSRRIEFNGDSIMAGFCNLCEDPIEVFTPTLSYTGHRVPLHSPLVKADDYGMNPWGYKQESFVRSWPSLVCNSLHSTCHTMAWSGFGMVHHCCEGEIHIPDIFPSTLGSDGTSPAWNFSSWIPDAVVINLGTNDGLDVKKRGARESRYMEVYYNFILNISSWYGTDTHFFLGCGPMSNDYCDYLHKVISRLRAENSAINVHFLDHRNLMDQTNACCNHPNAALGDITLARVATKFIGETMKWIQPAETRGTLAGMGKKKSTSRHTKKHCDEHKGWLLPCDP